MRASKTDAASDTSEASESTRRSHGEGATPSPMWGHWSGGVAAPGAALPMAAQAALEAPGLPLGSSIVEGMSPALGMDLSSVRVHTDGAAAAAATSLGARAFTYGHHVVFGAGEYRPDVESGRQLLTHELTHVAQQQRGGPVGEAGQEQQARSVAGGAPFVPSGGAPTGPVLRLQEVGEAVATPSADAAAVNVQAEAQAILQALDGVYSSGYTSGSQQQRIRIALTTHDGATTSAIWEALFRLGKPRGYSADAMVDWVRSDVTSSDWLAIRAYALEQDAIPNPARFAARELIRVHGEADGLQVEAILRAFGGPGLEQLLAALEAERDTDTVETAKWLVGSHYTVGLDSVERPRVAAYLDVAGGARALHYAAIYRADEIYNLLWYPKTSGSSRSVVQIFTSTHRIGRALIMQRLGVLLGDQKPADWLQAEVTYPEYNQLRELDGLNLEVRDEPTGLEKLLYGTERTLSVAVAVLGCIPLGLVTGVLSVVWDLVVMIWDLIKAVGHTVGLIGYLVTGGNVGRESYQAFGTFFASLAKVFQNPGVTFQSWWKSLQDEYAAIDGAWSDCLKAEYITRTVVNALATVILIFAGGYGLVKGVASGARTSLAAGRMLAGAQTRAVLLGEAAGAAGRTGRSLWSGVGRGVAALQGLSLSSAGQAVSASITRISQAVSFVAAAAQDFSVWQALRGAPAAMLAAEREYWATQRLFWTFEADAMAAEQQALITRLQRVANAEGVEAAASAVATEAAALEESSHALVQTVSGEQWVRLSRWETAADPARVEFFHQLPVHQLPHLQAGYGWAREGAQWVVYRAPDAPDVPLRLLFWGPDANDYWAAVVHRPSDGARVSSIAQFRNVRTRQERNTMNFVEPTTGRRHGDGHLIEQTHAVEVTESRVAATGVRATDRDFFTSRHHQARTPEPRWWNEQVRNNIVQAVHRRLTTGTNRSQFGQRQGLTEIRYYRVLQEFGPDSIAMRPVRGEPVLSAEAEWFILLNEGNEPVAAFRIPFNDPARPPNATTRDLGIGWETLLTDYERPLADVPSVVMVAPAGEVVAAGERNWMLLLAGIVGVERLLEESDTANR